MSPRTKRSNAFPPVACITTACVAIFLLIAPSTPGAQHIGVANASELQATLRGLKAGDTITLADGTWSNVTMRIEGRGTSAAPITLRAETPGEVRFTGPSYVRIAGEFIVVSGLRFEHCRGPRRDHAGSVVSFVGATHCRLTECAFYHCGVDRQFQPFLRLEGGSAENRIDHCFVTDFKAMGMAVGGDAANRRNRFDHNYFHNCPRYWNNGGECYQFGQGGEHTENSHRNVAEFTLFDGVDGDSEIISVKSADNIARFNTVRNSPRGGLVLRGGSRCRVEGNLLFGSGIRVHGTGHTITNNHIEGARYGIRLPSNTDGNHVAATDSLVADNTVVGCSGAALSVGAGAGDDPHDVTFRDNLLAAFRDVALNDSTPRSRNRWQGNVVHVVSPAEPGTVDGRATVKAVQLVRTNGAWRLRPDTPATSAAAKALTCSDAVVRPLSPHDVGPTWLRPAAGAKAPTGERSTKGGSTTALTTAYGATPDNANFLLTTPQGVTFEVTSNGLTRIAVAERTLACGDWSLFNAEHWFSKGRTNGPVRAKAYQKKTLEILSPSRARVHHVQDDVTSLFDYTFEGEDVTISARVENNHPTAELRVTGFRGLSFTFDRPPEGLHHAMHPSYSQAHGIGICHPSHQNRIGGRYACDDAIGVGVSPWNCGLERTLILFDYGSWAADKRDNDPVRKLIVLRPTPIPPRGARTFDIRLRISTNRDWKHLLEPYREHFQQAFGGVRYRSDSRWIATDYLNHSQAAVSPTNPYGFHGGHRRIDTPDGAAVFCDKVLPTLKDCDGQAVIVWGQGGDEPRGQMYRADFDVLPPQVEQQWKAIIAPRFKAAGIGLGVTTRPRHLAVRKDWMHDRTIDINPDDPGHRAMLWQRFERMIALGCTHFYLDSFGASFEDVKLMRWLRERLGPDVLTYAEHQCDAIVPFSGGYSESTLHADEPGEPPHYRLWSGVHNWEIYRWLCPGAQIATRLYQVKGDPPADVQPVDRWCARNQLIPLVPVNAFGKRAAGIKAIQDGVAPARGR